MLPKLAKEKHWKVLLSLIEVIETVCEEEVFESKLDLKSFFTNFLDNMMSYAKGESQKKLEELIPQLWDAWENKS